MKDLHLEDTEYDYLETYPCANISTKITYVFPHSLRDNKILLDNIKSHKSYMFEQYRELNDYIKNYQYRVDNCCIFDSEVAVENQKTKQANDKYNKVFNQINQSISPYYWEIYQRNKFVPEIDKNVESDYICLFSL